MLFRKSDNPQCATCSRSSHLTDMEMLCSRHGVVGKTYHCRAYRYDPLKRKPQRNRLLKKPESEHFSLD